MSIPHAPTCHEPARSVSTFHFTSCREHRIIPRHVCDHSMREKTLEGIISRLGFRLKVEHTACSQTVCGYDVRSRLLAILSTLITPPTTSKKVICPPSLSLLIPFSSLQLRHPQPCHQASQCRPAPWLSNPSTLSGSVMLQKSPSLQLASTCCFLCWYRSFRSNHVGLSSAMWSGLARLTSLSEFYGGPRSASNTSFLSMGVTMTSAPSSSSLPHQTPLSAVASAPEENLSTQKFSDEKKKKLSYASWYGVAWFGVTLT